MLLIEAPLPLNGFFALQSVGMTVSSDIACRPQLLLHELKKDLGTLPADRPVQQRHSNAKCNLSWALGGAGQ